MTRNNRRTLRRYAVTIVGAGIGVFAALSIVLQLNWWTTLLCVLVAPVAAYVLFCVVVGCRDILMLLRWVNRQLADRLQQGTDLVP